MWKVALLVAVDESGNTVTVDKEKVTVAVVKESARVTKKFPLKHTPPCLSVAVEDLLKILRHQNIT